MFEKQIGIDLGTVNVIVYVSGKGIILREPSVVAISARDNKIVAVGQEARDMLGRTPESIEVARPLRAGVVADYVVTEAMLRYFIRRAIGRNPAVAAACDDQHAAWRHERGEPRRSETRPSKQVLDEAYLIPEPLAAAYGAGLPIGTPTGNMVVDIGGGTTEAAVVSMYDIVVWSSVRVGGNRIDDAIINYVRKKYNLLIGEQTAEEIKIKIGSALPLAEDLKLEVRGRDQVAGLPRTIEISSEEVTEGIAEPLAAIVGTVKQTLEKTPPELAADIIDRGMVLTGGGSLLRNIDDLLTRENGCALLRRRKPDGLHGNRRRQGLRKLRGHVAELARIADAAFAVESKTKQNTMAACG